MHTNYIFSSIIYTFGWLAGIFIIVLSIIFFIRLFKITKEVKDNYGKLLVATFSSLFIIQFIYNILMILGLAPINRYIYALYKLWNHFKYGEYGNDRDNIQCI